MATAMQPEVLQDTSPPGRGSDGQSPGMAQAARDQAGVLWDDTKQTARAKLGEHQEAAASGLGDFAGALRNAAKQVDSARNPTVARFAEQAADALERFSGSLRSKDLDSMLREVESVARRQPALFIGASVAAGFLAVRFLKSSKGGERHG
jgi:hypothetical protein